MSDHKIRFASHEQVRSLFGTNDRNLRKIRDKLHIDVVLRGDELRLSGDQTRVDEGTELVTQLRSVIERKGHLPDEDFERILNRGARFTDKAPPRDKGGERGSDDGPGIDVFHKSRRIYPMGAGQHAYIEAIKNNDLVICGGPAGSGKTYLAVAMAVNALRQERVRKIVLVRPAVEAGEKLGFLPGDMFAKVNPYLRPLLDALGDILDFDTVQRYIDRDVIEILPLAFMRGRTLNNTFIILDEAQNTTTVQMKMFLTRMGQGSKIVVTGDATQVDLAEHVQSGLTDAIGRLQNVPGVAVMQLTPQDIVRHPLVRRIVAAYDTEQRDAARPATQEAPADASASAASPPSTEESAATPAVPELTVDGVSEAPQGDSTDHASAVSRSVSHSATRESTL